jgi:glyoxylase-like metal-dependent hydrolase (beta-lactamase superfamily II)
MPLNRRFVALASAALITACLSAMPWSTDAQELDRTRGLRELKPGFYVYQHGDDTPGVSSTFNNGVIVTTEGVIVIDGQRTEPLARQVREAIAQVTKQPIRYLISCTPHIPFTGGNGAYADVFRIGHEHERTDLLKLIKDLPAEEQKKRIPHATYSDRMTLYLGGKEIQILYLGRAHSRADAAVFIPQDRILYLSEIFYSEEFPYISEGYSGDWLNALEKAAAMKADIFVPGHGFLPRDLTQTREGLRNQRQVLGEVREAVRKQVEKGATVEEAVRAIDLPQLKRFKGYEKALEIAIRRIHRELTVGLP